MSDEVSLRKANIAKIKAIMEHIAKHGSFKGLLQEPGEELIKYAKKLFPDCDVEFIKRNLCDIGGQKRNDTICELCAAGVLSEGCPFVGHKQFLKINPRGGNTYMCADSEICGKYAGERIN